MLESNCLSSTRSCFTWQNEATATDSPLTSADATFGTRISLGILAWECSEAANVV